MLTRWKSWLSGRTHMDVRYRSINQNVYHCTVQKCASQWIRRIFSDPRVFRYSGLESFQYQHQLPGKFDPRTLTQRRFTKAFPDATIATPLYLDFDGFASIPKPLCYKAFFVMRDPRDIIVSWYFSTKLSHKAQGDIERIRQELCRLPKSDGLRFALNYLADFGLFASQRSWVNASELDANILLMRYEDLIANERVQVERLLRHGDIRVPGAELNALLNEHSFEQLAGRPRGAEDAAAHYRKGVAGDWRNHFDADLERSFADAAGDVLALWNYAG
jgi:Sulfotransferase domain